jgi:hypothetical protein
MADEETQVKPASETSTSQNAAWHPAGVPPKDSGWYPIGASRTDQAFWDGQTWTERRHWTVNGWVEHGAAATAGAGASQATRTSGNPYAPPATRPKAGPVTVSLGVFLVMVCGITLMAGSVGSWVSVGGSVGVAGFHVSLNGLDPGISTLIGVNGYVTFIGGIVLLVLGGLALTNSDVLLAILTAVAAAVILVFAIFDMFRIVQKISQVTPAANTSVSVGWGLIAVLSAGVLATLVSLLRLASR